MGGGFSRHKSKAASFADQQQVPVKEANKDETTGGSAPGPSRQAEDKSSEPGDTMSFKAPGVPLIES
jgi:hypothetical protein